jgi:hypothetical protein
VTDAVAAFESGVTTIEQETLLTRGSCAYMIVVIMSCIARIVTASTFSNNEPVNCDSNSGWNGLNVVSTKFRIDALTAFAFMLIPISPVAGFGKNDKLTSVNTGN